MRIRNPAYNILFAAKRIKIFFGYYVTQLYEINNNTFTFFTYLLDCLIKFEIM